MRLTALADAPDAFWATLEDERDRPESFWRQWLATTTAFIASRENQDVGLAMLGRYDDRPDEAGVYAVWVALQARGLGVGEALLQAVVDEAVAAQTRRLLLDVGDHNEPAMRLYERLGFVPTGRRSAFPPPRDHITEHELALELPGERDPRGRGSRLPLAMGVGERDPRQQPDRDSGQGRHRCHLRVPVTTKR